MCRPTIPVSLTCCAIAAMLATGPAAALDHIEWVVPTQDDSVNPTVFPVVAKVMNLEPNRLLLVSIDVTNLETGEVARQRIEITTRDQSTVPFDDPSSPVVEIVTPRDGAAVNPRRFPVVARVHSEGFAAAGDMLLVRVGVSDVIYGDTYRDSVVVRVR